MTTTLAGKRQKTTLDEVAERYPDVPRLLIIKTDVQRRGVFYTDAALSLLDEAKHQTTGTHIFGARDGVIALRPESLLLRDGTSIITTPTPLEENPYVVDVLDGKLDDGADLMVVDGIDHRHHQRHVDASRLEVFERAQLDVEQISDLPVGVVFVSHAVELEVGEPQPRLLGLPGEVRFLGEADAVGGALGRLVSEVFRVGDRVQEVRRNGGLTA